MKFIAYINVMPLKALLDPQGKAVTSRLHTMDLSNVEDVRVGKRMELTIEAKNIEEAEKAAEKACREMLHNPIMESYEFTLVESKVKNNKPAAESAKKKSI